MIIEKIQGLKQGSVIPKPKATAEFKIKGWGTRRGEAALTYWIPNHKSPGKPLVKGVTVTEFQRAYNELLESARFTRGWFNSNLPACAKEGSCNFTTIGGVFQLLGVAHYARPGTYIQSCAIDADRFDPLGSNEMVEKILSDVLNEQTAATGSRSVVGGLTESIDEEGKARFTEAIEGLGRLFGTGKTADE